MLCLYWIKQVRDNISMNDITDAWVKSKSHQITSTLYAAVLYNKDGIEWMKKQNSEDMNGWWNAQLKAETDVCDVCYLWPPKAGCGELMNWNVRELYTRRAETQEKMGQNKERERGGGMIGEKRWIQNTSKREYVV